MYCLSLLNALFCIQVHPFSRAWQTVYDCMMHHHMLPDEHENQVWIVARWHPVIEGINHSLSEKLLGKLHMESSCQQAVL